MNFWTNLKEAIRDIIKENGNQEITGPLLQSVLLNIVSSVGEHATFAGIATADTVPITDKPVFYIVTGGFYPNFSQALVYGPSLLSMDSEGQWTITPLYIRNSNNSNSDALPIIRAFSKPSEYYLDEDEITFSEDFSKIVDAGYEIVLFRYADVRPRHTTARSTQKRPKRVSARGYHLVTEHAPGTDEPVQFKVYYKGIVSRYPYIRIKPKDLFTYKVVPSVEKIVIRHGGRTRINLRFAEDRKELKFGIGLFNVSNNTLLQLIPFSISVFANGLGGLEIGHVKI